MEGWGAFLRDGANKGDFICEYLGEHISQAESEVRGLAYDRLGVTYLYQLQNLKGEDEGVIDAFHLGNKAKFVNCPPGGVSPNVEAEMWHVDGEPRIILVATRKIDQGEELLFDYNLLGEGKVLEEYKNW